MGSVPAAVLRWTNWSRTSARIFPPTRGERREPSTLVWSALVRAQQEAHLRKGLEQQAPRVPRLRYESSASRARLVNVALFSEPLPPASDCDPRRASRPARHSCFAFSAILWFRHQLQRPMRRCLQVRYWKSGQHPSPMSIVHPDRAGPSDMPVGLLDTHVVGLRSAALRNIRIRV